MIDSRKLLSVAPVRAGIVSRLRLNGIDRLMLAASVGLIGASVFVLASASRHEVPGEPFYFALRQGIYGAIGIALMVTVWRLDYSRLRELRVGLYSAMLASIAVVFALGSAVRGSTRWIELPYLRFQPSELAKVLLIVALAAFVYERVRRPTDLQHTLRLLALGLAPAALVLLQPDLGTSVVLAAIALAILFFGLVPWQHFALIAAVAALLGGAAVALGPAVGFDPLHGYQEERLTAFLNPSNDPRDGSYQVNQSVIAVGSGETTGRGEDATQSELLFLPERHTDFVFAVIGERFGFAGAAVILLLYALLLWRVAMTVRVSRSFYGTLIAGGVLAMLAFQLFVNVGMNLGVMPVTGITLPLLSYGGSSVLVTFLALGLLQSVHVQARLDGGTPRRRRIAGGRKRRARAAAPLSPQFDGPAPRAGAPKAKT
jgi:rod shape determining protein RodA